MCRGKARHVLLDGHVGAVGAHHGAGRREIRGNVGEPGGVSRGDREVIAGRGERPGDRQADAARCPGDEPDGAGGAGHPGAHCSLPAWQGDLVTVRPINC